jgi:hypothetical protein
MPEQDEKRKLLKAAVKEVVEEVLAEQGKDKNNPPAPDKNKKKSVWDDFCEALGIE